MESQLELLNSATTGHSSTVDMKLHVGEATFPVLQSAGDAIKLSDCEMAPRGDGVLEIIVDGRSHRREIRVLAESPRANWIAIGDASERDKINDCRPS